VFRTPRLTFRALHPDDLPAFHRWWSDPEIARFQVNGAIRLKKEETNTAMFERWFEDSPSGVGFSVVLTETDTLIGFCNLWGATIKDRSAYLGILLEKAHWGQGLGTEALNLLLHYAFTELNYHRVELTVNDFNARAIRAYQKVGFREVGRRREAIFREGTWHDEVIMDVLQREYLSKLEGRAEGP